MEFKLKHPTGNTNYVKMLEGSKVTGPPQSNLDQFAPLGCKIKLCILGGLQKDSAVSCKTAWAVVLEAAHKQDAMG